MPTLDALIAYADQLLAVRDYEDYAPNGLQVEGRAEVRRLVCGVTASLELIEAAAAHGADAVLVHHGWFWRGEDPRLVGMKGRRVRALLRQDMSLIAYHLPLDGHPELGNNARLGALLGATVEGRFGSGPNGGIAMYGALAEPLPLTALAARVAAALGREPLAVSGGERAVRRLGWCSGAAQGLVEQAARLGLDAYLSGEISEATVHTARELGIHYLACGHHATERGGVEALGRRLAEQFGVETVMLDLQNPA